MIQLTLSSADIAGNAELQALGVQAGDIINIPADAVICDPRNENDPSVQAEVIQTDMVSPENSLPTQ